jgi:hypothetical protein
LKGEEENKARRHSKQEGDKKMAGNTETVKDKWKREERINLKESQKN